MTPPAKPAPVPAPPPTPDPVTTDRLVAAIREGMATEPLLTEKARPVAEHMAAVIRTRLPNITPADTGELMIHLAAAVSVAMTVLSERGETPNSAILVATSAVAMAGLDLREGDENRYDSREAADSAVRLRAWFKAEGPLVMDEEDLDDVQQVLAAYERGATAQPTAEQDADVRAVAKVLDLYGKAPYQGLHEMELIAAHIDLQNRFTDRIEALEAREVESAR